MDIKQTQKYFSTHYPGLFTNPRNLFIPNGWIDLLDATARNIRNISWSFRILKVFERDLILRIDCKPNGIIDDQRLLLMSLILVDCISLSAKVCKICGGKTSDTIYLNDKNRFDIPNKMCECK